MLLLGCCLAQNSAAAPEDTHIKRHEPTYASSVEHGRVLLSEISVAKYTSRGTVGTREARRCDFGAFGKLLGMKDGIYDYDGMETLIVQDCLADCNTDSAGRCEYIRECESGKPEPECDMAVVKVVLDI